MSNVIEQQVEKLRSTIDEIGLDVTTGYTLADAIREGSTVSGQAHAWTDGAGNMCALSAAAVSAKARGFIK